MRTKKVNRYWCDFCNKAGLSASSMLRHEKHCTMNPHRECRVCKMVDEGRDVGFERISVADMVALLPSKDALIKHDQHGAGGYFADDQGLLKASLPALRKAAGGCPACILSALRQSKIPVPLAEDFNFSMEMKQIWSDINESRQARCYGD